MERGKPDGPRFAMYIALALKINGVYRGRIKCGVEEYKSLSIITLQKAILVSTVV